MLSTKIWGIRLEEGGGSLVEDEVALESPVNLYVNGRLLSTIFATPHDLEDLAYGHLAGEGIIDKAEDVEGLEIDGTDILIRLPPRLEGRIEAHKEARLILSSCGSVEDFFEALSRMARPRVYSNFKLKASDIMKALRTLSSGTSSLKRSIAVHTAALILDGNPMAIVEDVSRHVTVDKAIGRGLRLGIDFSRCILATTGRQASDMVLKASRVGIPVTLSLRGPLYSGVFAALKTGITLISTARGKGLTIYTHPERVILDELKQDEI